MGRHPIKNSCGYCHHYCLNSWHLPDKGLVLETYSAHGGNDEIHHTLEKTTRRCGLVDWAGKKEALGWQILFPAALGFHLSTWATGKVADFLLFSTSGQLSWGKSKPHYPKLGTRTECELHLGQPLETLRVERIPLRSCTGHASSTCSTRLEKGGFHTLTLAKCLGI